MRSARLHFCWAGRFVWLCHHHLWRRSLDACHHTLCCFTLLCAFRDWHRVICVECREVPLRSLLPRLLATLRRVLRIVLVVEALDIRVVLDVRWHVLCARLEGVELGAHVDERDGGGGVERAGFRMEPNFLKPGDCCPFTADFIFLLLRPQVRPERPQPIP